MKLEVIYRFRLVVLGASLALMSAGLFFLKFVFFQTNDDFTQMLILSGLLYGEPASDAMYLSKVFGIPLSKLYLYFENVGWYGLFLLVIQMLSIFYVLSLLIYKKYLWGFLLSLIIFIMFIPLYFSLQYTQTSLIASGLGAIGFLNAKNKWQSVVGLILIFIGVSIRLESGITGALVAVVIHLFFNNFSQYKKIIAIGLIMVLGFGLGNGLNRFLDKETDYDYYSSLAKVLDYNPTGSTKDQIRRQSNEVGWSKNDAGLLLDKFYFADRELYTVEKNQQLEIQTDSFTFYAGVFKNLFKIIKNEYLVIVGFSLFILIISLLVFSRVNIYQVLGMGFFVFSLFFLILSQGRLPYRVVMPILMVALLAFIAEATLKSDVLGSKRMILAVIAVPFLFLQVQEFLPVLKEERKLQAVRGVDLYEFNRLLEYSPDKPVIAFSSFYSVLMKTYAPAVGPADADDIYRNLVLIGWTIRSSANDEYLNELGVSENLFDSIAFEDAYLATGEHEVELKMVSRYLRQNRNVDIKWELAPHAYNQTGLGIWKVESFTYLR